MTTGRCPPAGWNGIAGPPSSTSSTRWCYDAPRGWPVARAGAAPGRAPGVGARRRHASRCRMTLFATYANAKRHHTRGPPSKALDDRGGRGSGPRPPGPSRGDGRWLNRARRHTPHCRSRSPQPVRGGASRQKPPGTTRSAKTTAPSPAGAARPEAQPPLPAKPSTVAQVARGHPCQGGAPSTANPTRHLHCPPFRGGASRRRPSGPTRRTHRGSVSAKRRNPAKPMPGCLEPAAPLPPWPKLPDAVRRPRRRQTPKGGAGGCPSAPCPSEPSTELRRATSGVRVGAGPPRCKPPSATG